MECTKKSPRTEASEDTNPTNTLSLDFQPQSWTRINYELPHLAD